MRERVDRYVEKAQAEIVQSGWVLNVLGPEGQKMVKKIEVKEGRQFHEVKLDQVRDIIAGYPLSL